jgi:Rhodopirellula transposase DDE domain
MLFAKKELIGNFKNGGTDYRPKRKLRRVNVHDFEDKKRGKIVPYRHVRQCRLRQPRDHKRHRRVRGRAYGAAPVTWVRSMSSF